MSGLRCQIAPGVTWKEIDGLVVAVHLPSGRYFSLNETASDVWRRALKGEDVSRIGAALAEAYEVDVATAESDATSCIEEWMKEGLVNSAASGAAGQPS
ncbi:MAG TPA: PqqD family protein [Candidatus Brocadiia bacterium]|nr:PqqD family protein [Candidatus Brocadiia bacterium]